MASAPLSIAQQALINLGADPIIDINDGSKPADLCNTSYIVCRDYVLQEHPWTRAIKRQVLTPALTPITKYYQYTYPFPVDLLRPVANDDDLFDFHIEGRNFLCDRANFEVRYIWKVDDVNIFDPHLAETIGWYLSTKIAYSLTQNSAVVDMAGKEYARKLARAKFIDSSTKAALKQKQDFFIEARLQGNQR